MSDQPTPTPRTAAFFAARPLTLDGQTLFFCEQLERELAEARADAARLLSELADERAKKSDALIAAVDDIERLTAERDDAAALAKNYAARMARSDAELAAARTALAQ